MNTSSLLDRLRCWQEYQHMNADTQEHHDVHRDYRFALGLATGALVGAGLAIWLAPRLASELRERVTDSAKDIGRRASDHYEHAKHRFGEAVDAHSNPRAL
jgi:hypothetical protein